MCGAQALRMLSLSSALVAPTITSFSDARFDWVNGAPKHKFEAGGTALAIRPSPGLDYWGRTFYDPLVVKHDAQCLLTDVAAEEEAALVTAFTLVPRAQFDQAGVMVLVDERTWAKAGIEFVDDVPRLSCVVTNDGFSDWSTATWGHWDDAAQASSMRVRITKLLPGSKQGPALLFETAPWVEGALAETEAKWEQVRVASLRSGKQPWRMGVYANSPIAANGSYSRFHHILLGPKPLAPELLSPDEAADV